MKKLLLLLILSFFSAQSFAGSCPDGSDPVKSISDDGTYFVYKCGGSAATSSNTFEIQNPNKYCPSVILPNDVASGKKYNVCLFDKTAFKEYGLRVVDKKDGHPVRAGSKSMRFELRDGDCNDPPPPAWNDCKNDRERFELSGRDMFDGEEGWYAWSIFIPKDYVDIETGATDLGQFNLEPGEDPDPCCVFLINKKKDGYVMNAVVDKYYLNLDLSPDEMSGNWNDFLVNFKWSKKDNGFIKLWLNNKLVFEYTGQTLTRNTEFVYFKFGIYRSALSRYLNQKNFSPEVEACFEKNGASAEVIDDSKNGRNSQLLGWGANAISFKIYNQCKHLYKIKAPTQIVYYDEVRSAETCKKLKLEDLEYNCKDLESQTNIVNIASELSIFAIEGETLNLTLDKVDFSETVTFDLEREEEGYLQPYQLHKGYINGYLNTKSNSIKKFDFRANVYKYAGTTEQNLMIHMDDPTIKPLKRHKDSLEKKCGSNKQAEWGWLSFISQTNNSKSARNQQCMYDYFKEANDREALELFQAVLGGTDSILDYLQLSPEERRIKATSELSIFESDGERFNLTLDKVDFSETGPFELEREEEGYLQPYQLHKGHINGYLNTKSNGIKKFRTLVYKYADTEEQKLVIHMDDPTIKPLKRHKDSLQKLNCGLDEIEWDWLSFISQTNDINSASYQQCIYDYFKEANDSEAWELFQAVLGGTDSILDYLETNVVATKEEEKRIPADLEPPIFDDVEYKLEGQILKINIRDPKMKPLMRHIGGLTMKCGSGLIDTKSGWISFVSSNSNSRTQQCHYDYFQKSNDSEALELFKAVLSGTNSIFD